jgi:hypothetical protein
MKALVLAAVLSLFTASAAVAVPHTINVNGRIDINYIGIYEKGRAIWVEAFRKAEALLKKLDRAINGDMEEHERQCFLQEAVKHFAPEVKDDVSLTGKPMGHATPEFLKHVLTKLDQVNRCSASNRGYIAFHAWKDSGFQEPRQLPEGQKMTLTEFLRGLAGAGAAMGVGRIAPAAAVPAGPASLPLLGNPESYTPDRLRPVPDGA